MNFALLEKAMKNKEVKKASTPKVDAIALFKELDAKYDFINKVFQEDFDIMTIFDSGVDLEKLTEFKMATSFSDIIDLI